MRFKLNQVIINDSGTYEYLFKIFNSLSNCDDNELELDFSNTKIFESNLIAVLYMIIDVASEQNKTVKFIFKCNEIYEGKSGAYKCFSYYANKEYRKSFLKPRCVVGNPNTKEVEDVLTKFLYDLDLYEQDKISIMISELIANIKMHVIDNNIPCKGFMSSAVNKSETDLYITIVNNGKSIRNILKNNRMEFKSDIEAICWALKKTNSTRKDDETGGLGLYFLRKFINELNGDIIICSGRIMLLLKNGGYSLEDENYYIEDNEINQLSIEFDGTLITLRIPYKKNVIAYEDGLEEDRYTDLISILKE